MSVPCCRDTFLDSFFNHVVMKRSCWKEVAVVAWRLGVKIGGIGLVRKGREIICPR